MFSVFSPSSIFGLHLNWLSSIMCLLVLPTCFWMTGSLYFLVMVNLLKALHQEFKVIFGRLNYPGMTLITLSLFFYILLNNFLGLFPYIFTASSHGSFTVALALPLWMGHMMMAFMLNIELTMAHFVPVGTPGPLIPLMVIIEFISSIIRPFTLAVRLAANMVAGHLLLGLLSEKLVDSSVGVFFGCLFGLLLLGMLELGVSMIQAYVFSLLSTLYVNEVSSTTFL